MDVVLPPIDPALNGTIVTGQATMEIGAPHISGASAFTVARDNYSREFEVYVMEPDQYERLQATYPRFTPGSVAAVDRGSAYSQPRILPRPAQDPAR